MAKYTTFKKKKMSTGTIVVIGVAGIVGIIAIDHYVLKGRLGISGHVNMLIGRIKEMLGQGAGPITPTAVDPATLGQGGEFEGSPEEASLLEAEEQIAAKEPETASVARRRAYTSRGYRPTRVRLGGVGY